MRSRVLMQRYWVLVCTSALLTLLATNGLYAQTRPMPSIPAGKKAGYAEPAPEAGPRTLSASKVEEALRLLLKATAKDSTQGGPRQQAETEISGLIIDQTLTKIGHDFYGLFYTQWDPPPNLGDFVVVIREKPGRGISTLIAIEVNDNALLELPLSPNYEATEEAASYSLALATEYLVNARGVSQQLEKTDDNPGTEVY